MAKSKPIMKTLHRITFLSLLLVAGIPALHAGYNRPRVLKSITTDKNPAVIAARNRHQEAEKVLEEAQAKNDKTAIEAAQKEHDVTQKALTAARNKAFADGRKQQQQQQRRRR